MENLIGYDFRSTFDKKAPNITAALDALYDLRNGLTRIDVISEKVEAAAGLTNRLKTRELIPLIAELDELTAALENSLQTEYEETHRDFMYCHFKHEIARAGL